MSFPTDSETVVVHRGEGASVTAGGSRCIFKLTGRDTNDRFGLFELTMAPRAMGATPHTHHELIEIFYVLEGQVEFLTGDQRVIGRPGTLVSVPPEIVHAFANTSHVTATMLLMFCPADAREKYFEGLAELTKDGREPEHHEIVALMRRFNSEPVEGISFP